MKVDDEDIFFPDPRPSISLKTPNNKNRSNEGEDLNRRIPHINDVSRMSAYPNGTPVSKILFPRSEEDVVNILKAAHSANKQIGIRGTKHSMGGQSIVSQEGWEIDCKYLREIHYEKSHNRVRCGPGCHWADLIKILNVHGKSPRTMQSYCSFSIGGTLAVNAHGITTDFCFAESVLEFRLALITADGKAEVIVCRPRCKRNQEQESSLSSDLFRLALGGYGLFGVITEVLMKVEDNSELELSTMHLKVQPADYMHEDINPSEFVRIYDNCRNANMDKSYVAEGSLDALPSLGKVEMKLARLNTINLEKASFYVFRRSYSSRTVSELPATPRRLSTTSQLLYKWAMPLLKDLRYAKEESTGKAIDFDQSCGSSKNQLLFESAVPLSRLYNPLVKKDDTFILQEFFCPHDKFSQWIDAIKPIYKDIETQQKKQNHQIILLNTTIRYVEEDDRTFLSYSRVPGGVFAFVLYYRIQRNKVVERYLGDFHNRLAEVTISMGGTFYLPYRKCYSPELLKKAYPMIDEFAEMKERLDPNCLFSNLWFEHYVLPLCSSAYRTKWENMNSANASVPLNVLHPDRYGKIIHNHKEFLHQLPRREEKDMLRRKNSYRNLLRSKELRDEFRDQFLVQIFSLANPEEVMNVMARAAWDPANKNDIHIFEHIRRHFHDPTGKTSFDLASLPRFWRGIQQLRRQKDELTRQTLSVVSKLGMLGQIKNYVCIGDNGKTVKQFVDDLHITGKIWLIHDKVYHDTLPPIAVVLERGSIDKVADEELAYDYVSDVASKKLSKIPSGSIDMVTMNQGIHHIPLENLFGFLIEILRMLQPGGLFILREHDLKVASVENPSVGKAQYPMLDIAHSVFNAVMGVTVEEEAREIRAFRSILEWRKILESVGFVDTLVYEIEDGDPTWDEMLCFCKPKEDILSNLSIPNVDKNKKVFSAQNIQKVKEEHNEPPIIGLINTLLSQLPELVVSKVSILFQNLSQGLPKIQNKLTDLLIVVIPYIITQNEKFFGSDSRLIAKQVGDIFEPIITGFFNQVLGFVNGSIALLSESELKEAFYFKNIGRTTELYLLLPYLQKKVKLAPSEANQIEKKVVSFIEEYLPSLLPQKLQDTTLSSFNDNQIRENIPPIDDKVVTAREVQEFVIELEKTLPGILNTESILLQSGFSLAQQASLVGQFGGHDLPSACATLANYLDRKSWNILKLELTTAATTGDLPTKSLLLGNGSESHPWNQALKTFFTSPKVKLNEKAIFGLRLIGLSEIGHLYREAKRDYEAERVQPCFETRYDKQISSQLNSFDDSINQMRKAWKNDIVERTITYSMDSSQEDCLLDVAEIIQAKFGYTSITSRKVDITAQLQVIHSSIHSNLVNSEYNYYVPDGVQLGYLPINEALLVQIRNKGSARRQLGDNFRQSFVNVATLGTAGYNQLEIKYRGLNCQSNRTNSGGESVQSALDSGYFESLTVLSKDLCSFLELNNITRSDLHPNDGAYTWFKLNEWMQVEILDELVKSLEHTPWFRFPFQEFIKLYFEVFQQQCGIVQEKYGIIKAYGSMPFLIDLVPGIVMTILFSQLKSVAIPLQIALPDGYDDDKSRFLEDVVLHLPLNLVDTNNCDNYFKATLDKRILKTKPLPGNFMVCTLPTFKAMGEILKKFAIRFPSARVFQISNQFEVQVRVSLERSQVGQLPNASLEEQYEADLQRVLQIPGVELKMSYHYPNTRNGGAPVWDPPARAERVYYCLQVHCLALFDVFRLCNLLPNHQVEQVYDFYN